MEFPDTAIIQMLDNLAESYDESQDNYDSVDDQIELIAVLFEIKPSNLRKCIHGVTMQSHSDYWGKLMFKMLEAIKEFDSENGRTKN